jgi:hypothetical protein
MAATAGTVPFLDDGDVRRDESRPAWLPSDGVAAERTEIGWPTAPAQTPTGLVGGLRSLWAGLVRLHFRQYEDAARLPPEHWFQGY